MNCPVCNAVLPPGRDDCPACAAGAVPVEGALAPDLSPRRASVEPLRELPGKRRRERTWKDEVRERVDRRRQEVLGLPAADGRDGAALPLFPDTEKTPLASAPPRVSAPARRTDRRPARASAARPAAEAVTARPPRAIDASASGPSVLDAPTPARASEGAASVLDDLPLRAEPTADAPASRPDPLALLGEPPLVAAPAARLRTRDDERDDDLPLRARHDSAPAEPAPRVTPPALALDEPPEEDWAIDAPRDVGEPRPLERPARALERLQAALIDTGLLLGMAVLVVYFAGRVAQVPLVGLRPAWPFLAGYLVFLGLAYASYFTGTTGQTVGKILLGLRVVDTGGHAPGYRRALLRGALGTLGTLAGGLGLVTVLFDPARRALHDRLLRTRVVSLRRA